MTVMLSPANAKVLGSAIGWGFANTAQVQAMGISPFNLTGLDGRVSRSIPLDAASAESAYRLLYVAEPDLGASREDVTDVMATLTAIASPRSIEQSAVRFTTCETFMKAFKARLGEAIDAVDCVNPIDITYGSGRFGRPSASSETDLRIEVPSQNYFENLVPDAPIGPSTFEEASETWWTSLER